MQQRRPRPARSARRRGGPRPGRNRRARRGGSACAQPISSALGLAGRVEQRLALGAAGVLQHDHRVRRPASSRYGREHARPPRRGRPARRGRRAAARRRTATGRASRAAPAPRSRRRPARSRRPGVRRAGRGGDRADRAVDEQLLVADEQDEPAAAGRAGRRRDGRRGHAPSSHGRTDATPRQPRGADAGAAPGGLDGARRRDALQHPRPSAPTHHRRPLRSAGRPAQADRARRDPTRDRGQLAGVAHDRDVAVPVGAERHTQPGHLGQQHRRRVAVVVVRPTLTTATGRAPRPGRRGSEYAEPWCGTFSTSARRSAPAASSACCASTSASPGSRIRTPSTSARSTSEELFGSERVPWNAARRTEHVQMDRADVEAVPTGGRAHRQAAWAAATRVHDRRRRRPGRPAGRSSDLRRPAGRGPPRRSPPTWSRWKWVNTSSGICGRRRGRAGTGRWRPGRGRRRSRPRRAGRRAARARRPARRRRRRTPSPAVATPRRRPRGPG